MKTALHLIYSFSVIIPLTIVLGAIALFVYPFDLFERSSRLSEGKLGRGGIWVKVTWFRLILWTHRVRLQIGGLGREALKQMKGVVFVCNHQSVLDIPSIASVLPENSAFLAKRELARIPVFGTAAKIVGTQFVDRSKGQHDLSLEDLNRLIQKGVSIILFPEGTRSTTGELLSFKRGAAVLAISNQTSIVPLAVDGTRKLCPKKSLFIRPGRVQIVVGEPISTRGLTIEDRATLTDQVKSVIAKHLTSMRQ